MPNALPNVLGCGALCCAMLCCADVDFDDYHVWAALQEAKYRPRVVSIEVSSRIAAWLHGCRDCSAWGRYLQRHG